MSPAELSEGHAKIKQKEKTRGRSNSSTVEPAAYSGTIHLEGKKLNKKNGLNAVAGKK